MNDLFWMLTVIDRHSTERFIEFYGEYGLETNLITVARGTAGDDVLSVLGLDTTEKAVMFTVITWENWKSLSHGLRSRMRIDVPGRGIAFIIPMSSIGGKRLLRFLTSGQDYEKGEESVLKGTKYELLAVIAEQGYTDMVMDAAREARAGGGTVIHARGTGVDKSEGFLGVKIAHEKELTLIVVHSSVRKEVMRAIMDKAGTNTKAKALCFSLPVTDTAGMRLIDDDFDQELAGA